MRTMGEISGHPQLLALYRTHLLSPRMGQIRGLIVRACSRGEVNDTPTDVAAAIIAGPLFIHALTTLVTPDLPWTPNLAEALARSMLNGIASTAPSSDAIDRQA
jgi:hypothetical protein